MADAPQSNDFPALQITDLEFAYSGTVQTSAAEDPENERQPEHDHELRLRVSSLTLKRGQQVLLTGGSGSGKSTLLHLIAGLIDPTAGRVSVAGRNIHALKGAARDAFRGSNIGMIFQTFNLLHGLSALENVLTALMFSNVPKGEHMDRAQELLKTLGIVRVHAEPTKMSVGQQQRVAVARALVCRPALVLADEPTASLDPENAKNAMDLIQKACESAGAALLCVSHDPAMHARFGEVRTLSELSRVATKAGAR